LVWPLFFAPSSVFTDGFTKNSFNGNREGVFYLFSPLLFSHLMEDIL